MFRPTIGFTMLFYAAATFLLGVVAYVTAGTLMSRDDDLRSLLVTGTWLVMVVGPVVFLAAAAGAMLTTDHDDAAAGARTTR